MKFAALLSPVLVRSVLLILLAVAVVGCANRKSRPVADHDASDIVGRWTRHYTINERDHKAHVSEVWQFNRGGSASVRAMWEGEVPEGAEVEDVPGAGPYLTVVDQGFRWTPEGDGEYSLEERGHRLDGPKYMSLEDSYDVEVTQYGLKLDGGHSEVILQRENRRH